MCHIYIIYVRYEPDVHLNIVKPRLYSVSCPKFPLHSLRHPSRRGSPTPTPLTLSSSSIMVQAAGTSKDGVDAADAALGDLSVGDKPDAGAEKNDKEKKSSKKEKAKTIVIKVEKRGGKKMNTLIIGLDDFGVDLKDAAKIMKKKT